MKIKIIHISILLAMLLFPSCKNESAQEDTGHEEGAHHHDHDEENTVSLTEVQMLHAGVEFGTITPRQIAGTIRVNGKVDVPPQQLVSVSVPMGGFLRSTSLLQGSTVKKGQVLAVVENIDFIQIQQDYLEAKNHFALSEADYQRQVELSKENVNSQKTLQQSKATFLNWQSKYIALREKLNVLRLDPAGVEAGRISGAITLYSPIDGFVTEVNANIGKFVNSSDVLFEIVDTNNLHAELIVFEKDVRKIQVGQRVRFTLANETEERTGKVQLIGREISADRTIQVHCAIDKKDLDLLPGMYLSAVVETDSHPVPSLPSAAIVDYQGRKFVFVKGVSSEEHEGHDHSDEKEHGELNVFDMIGVSIGNSANGYTELAGVDSIRNSQVVVKGAYALLSMMKNSEEEGGHVH